jgi:hypothetical protein
MEAVPCHSQLLNTTMGNSEEEAVGSIFVTCVTREDRGDVALCKDGFKLTTRGSTNEQN